MNFPDEVLSDAERLLSQLAGTTVSVVRCDVLTHEASVARCVISGDDNLGNSVIIRTHRRTGGWRTEDSYLFNDYAAASFLGSIGSWVCARVVAADMDAGVEISEDLGPGPSLDDLLAGSDPAAATDGFVAFARSLGQLHSQTAGRAADYYRIRTPLGPTCPATYQRSLDDKPIDQAWAELVSSTSRDAGITVSGSISGEVDHVLEMLGSAQFLAFSNGDPCPYNCRMVGERARFFDFELAGFRHALLDAAHLWFPFPSCYRFGRLPDTTRAAAEQAYRTALAPHIPAALNDSAYLQGMAAACAAWAIAGTARVLAHDQPSAAQLQRLQATNQTFITAARTAGVLLPLADWFENLTKALGWQTSASMASAPLFPAFR